MSSNIETRILRDRDGWYARSNMDLDGNQLLNVRTYKTDKGVLRTYASVCTKVEGGTRHIMGFGTSGGDFSETLAASKPARVTEKVVTAQHESVLKNLPDVLLAVKAHYVKNPAKLAFA